MKGTVLNTVAVHGSSPFSRSYELSKRTPHIGPTKQDTNFDQIT